MKKFLKISILSLSFLSFFNANPSLGMKEGNLNNLFEQFEDIKNKTNTLEKNLKELQIKQNLNISESALNVLQKLYPDTYQKIIEIASAKVEVSKLLEEHKEYLTQNGSYDSFQDKVSKIDEAKEFKALQNNLESLLLANKTALKKIEDIKDHLEKIGAYNNAQKIANTSNLEELQKFNAFLDLIIKNKHYKKRYTKLEEYVKKKSESYKESTLANDYYFREEKLPLTLFLIENIQKLQIADCTISREQKELHYLTYLPNLKKLDVLNIGVYDEDLPENLNVETLWLSNNSFYALPSKILGYKNLKQLSINYQNIKNIPSLESLTSLKSLTISGNKELDTIEAFPLNINELTLSFNKIQKLPAMNHLEKLTYLSLKGNPIQTFDDNFFEMPALEFLDLAETAIYKIDEKIKNLKNLEKLYLVEYSMTITTKCKNLKISEDLKQYFKEKRIDVSGIEKY
jgi:Leucine-rich repeat (LRR) protein